MCPGTSTWAHVPVTRKTKNPSRHMCRCAFEKPVPTHGFGCRAGVPGALHVPLVPHVPPLVPLLLVPGCVYMCCLCCAMTVCYDMT